MSKTLFALVTVVTILLGACNPGNHNLTIPRAVDTPAIPTKSIIDSIVGQYHGEWVILDLKFRQSGVDSGKQTYDTTRYAALIDIKKYSDSEFVYDGRKIVLGPNRVWWYNVQGSKAQEVISFQQKDSLHYHYRIVNPYGGLPNPVKVFLGSRTK